MSESNQQSLHALLAQESESRSLTLSTDLLPSVDLATLLSEMAALKSEVRAETVASREQREQLQTTMQLMEESIQQSQKREESLRNEIKALQHKLTQQTGDAWLDALERVERSHQKALELAKPKRRWWRTITDPVAISLADGLGLTQHYIFDKLKSLGIQRIRTMGQPFDPQTMEALDTRHDPSQPDGVVVEELTPGYTDQNGTKRIAQVVVNQHKGISNV